MEFEWDASKATSNLKKHRISFEDAVGVFEHPVLEIRTYHGGEERYKAIGLLADLEIAVVYTVRNGRYRIISARRARKNERRAYQQAISGD